MLHVYILKGRGYISRIQTTGTTGHRVLCATISHACYDLCASGSATATLSALLGTSGRWQMGWQHSGRSTETYHVINVPAVPWLARVDSCWDEMGWARRCSLLTHRLGRGLVVVLGTMPSQPRTTQSWRPCLQKHKFRSLVQSATRWAGVVSCSDDK